MPDMTGMKRRMETVRENAKRQRVAENVGTPPESYEVVQPCAVECNREELDLFDPIVVQLDKQSAKHVEINALTPASQHITIELPKTSDYLDLAKSFVRIRGKYTRCATEHGTYAAVPAHKVHVRF